MFKVGDRIKIRTSGKTGTVKGVFEAEMWNLYGGDEYQVEFDDGSGALTVSERILEREHEITCECGIRFVRDANKHSTWCPMASFEN